MPAMLSRSAEGCQWIAVGRSAGVAESDDFFARESAEKHFPFFIFHFPFSIGFSLENGK
jgi:hypothetical protein